MTDAIDPKFFRSVMGPGAHVRDRRYRHGGRRSNSDGHRQFRVGVARPTTRRLLCTNGSYSWEQLKKADTLGVNVLGENQIDVSNACMRDLEERFEGLDWSVVDGAPRIAGTTAWMTLTENQIVDAGDHEFGLYNVTSMISLRTPTLRSSSTAAGIAPLPRSATSRS